MARIKPLWTLLVAAPAQLGEPPFWHPNEKRPHWVDMAGCARWPSDAEGDGAQSWPMPAEPGCIASARRGGIEACLDIPSHGEMAYTR